MSTLTDSGAGFTFTESLARAMSSGWPANVVDVWLLSDLDCWLCAAALPAGTRACCISGLRLPTFCSDRCAVTFARLAGDGRRD